MICFKILQEKLNMIVVKITFELNNILRRHYIEQNYKIKIPDSDFFNRYLNLIDSILIIQRYVTKP